MELRLFSIMPSIWMNVIHVLCPMNAVQLFPCFDKYINGKNISIIFIDTSMNDKTLQNIEILYR